MYIYSNKTLRIQTYPTRRKINNHWYLNEKLKKNKNKIMAKTELCKLRFETVEVQIHHSSYIYIQTKIYGWCGKYQSDELHIEWSKDAVAASVSLDHLAMDNA